MSLEIVNEDLFKVRADTVVITINLVGAMGAGIAKVARDTIPGLNAHYLKMYRKIDPTQFIVYTVNEIRYLLVPTKIDWRDPSPRGLVIHNLNRLAVLAARNRLGTVALPPMGCGNGGLDWENDISYVYRSILPFSEGTFITALGES